MIDDVSCSLLQARSQLAPGKCHSLARGVRRIVAGNAGMMTGPGTNTYLLGEREVAVVDPGPDDPRHLPVPATFLVDGKGVIRLAHVDVDYTRRLDRPCRGEEGKLVLRQRRCPVRILICGRAPIMKNAIVDLTAIDGSGNRRFDFSELGRCVPNSFNGRFDRIEESFCCLSIKVNRITILFSSFRIVSVFH